MHNRPCKMPLTCFHETKSFCALSQRFGHMKITVQKTATNGCYKSLFLKIKYAHSLPMLLKHFLLHNATLDYHGNFFVNDFVTVGIIFEYKFSKMLSDVCFNLSL